MEIVWAAETNRFVLRLPLPDLLRSETTLCQSLNDVNSVTSLFEQLQLRSRLQCAVKEPLVISLDGKEMYVQEIYSSTLHSDYPQGSPK